jgi:extracellular solute-binding protein
MKQIEAGAPADAFVSADLKWMDYGVEKKVINESTRINLLRNVLVLIAHKHSKIDHVDIEPGFDLGTSPAMVGSQPATSRRFRSGSTTQMRTARHLGFWSSCQLLVRGFFNAERPLAAGDIG